MSVHFYESLDQSFPKEGWTVDPRKAAGIIRKINTLTGKNTEKQANMILSNMKDFRGLMWHIPGSPAIKFLLNIERENRNIMLELARVDPEDFSSGLEVPGGDLDAWRKYIERIRFSASILAQDVLCDPKTLENLAEIVRLAMNNRKLLGRAS